MKARFFSSVVGACAGLCISLSACAQAAPEVTLTRLNCGTSRGPQDPNTRLSDVHAYHGLKIQLNYNCYLIKHGDDYMMWDTGQPMSAGALAPKVSLVDELAQIGVKPGQVRYVGISHYHADHTGQVGSFPNATLLIGKGDWDEIASPKPAALADAASFTHWTTGGGKVEPVPQDKDVFGDGTVAMLYTPGHTPGHHALLVKLRERGYVLLMGDVAHFRENYDSDGVPNFNTNRAATLASMERVRQLAANLKATVIIQHDPRDESKLPPFPAFAR
ncbi:MAG TPA: N-acyl homoserine lactonase family protein [Burkholderiales bacterium]|jgi:glyoxylase-like metal-dependent hydrolase (beta-lactamase superfamily II)